MRFASVASAWLAFAAAAGVASLALLAYRRAAVPISTARRGLLTGLRALTLAALTLVLLRPVLLVPPSASGLVVPVAIDVSRSMAIADVDERGMTRLAAAVALARSVVLPALPKDATVELFSIGGAVKPAALETLAPDASKTDLAGAIAALRDRYRGRTVGGIVLLSDGADTGRREADVAGGPPVLAIGIGSPGGPSDREITGMTAGDPRLDRASVDLQVSALSKGFDRTPFDLRVLANGQMVDTRRIAPRDGVPIEEVFAVFPDPALATVYTAEIVAERPDALPENNRRSVVVNPAGRRRRILVLAGAPGYDYSFLVRALGQDPSLEIDSVVRKGKNDRNVDTFIVQAGGSRGQLLTSGFPASREALAAYDAIVISNIEASFFTSAQLAMAAAFVGERGGGLLALGGRSFERRGLTGTPLEEVLPVESAERTGGVGVPVGEGDRARDTIVLTPEGQQHPIMRLGSSPEESQRLWASLPPPAFSTPMGAPRAGASVLAVTTGSSGASLPVVAVQRYGRGRSMVFAGEASWRWRMMLPATDRRYELFWRQALRWLTAEAPEPVSLVLPAAPEPGDEMSVDVDVRDPAFAPVADAAVSGAAVGPDGRVVPLVFRATAAGRLTAVASFDGSGLYRIRVEARRGTTSLGSAERWMYVGASARELADPRLNEAFLRRLARQSGGEYVRAADASSILSKLQTPAPPDAAPERRDVWHQPWLFALVMAALSAEWILRRAWGFR